MKVFKQIIYILIFCAAIGLAANAVNPGGIPLILEKNIYKQDTALKKDLGDFVNDPFDTTSKPAQIFAGKKNKQGFIEPENIGGILAKQLYDRKALFIDARTKAEYDTVHVLGAINIPYAEFYQKTAAEKTEIMKKYGKSGIIVVYCNGGKCEVSIDLAYEIAKIGYNNVSIYKGGIKEWEDSGNPVEKLKR
ncbi:MAG: rhodanese-like domain-containing protein [Ignavibacteria bacterium]|nr:rhodanese-like domain-containing protein [Ignavibacteria bacterium]